MKHMDRESLVERRNILNDSLAENKIKEVINNLDKFIEKHKDEDNIKAFLIELRV
jgi:hypothetical protein